MLCPGMSGFRAGQGHNSSSKQRISNNTKISPNSNSISRTLIYYRTMKGMLDQTCIRDNSKLTLSRRDIQKLKMANKRW